MHPLELPPSDVKPDPAPDVCAERPYPTLFLMARRLVDQGCWSNDQYNAWVRVKHQGSPRKHPHPEGTRAPVAKKPYTIWEMLWSLVWLLGGIGLLLLLNGVLGAALLP